MRLKKWAFCLSALLITSTSIAPMGNGYDGTLIGIAAARAETPVLSAEKEVAQEQTVTGLTFSLSLGKALGIQPIYPTKGSYGDVPRYSTEFGYVEAMVALGILSPGDQIQPHLPITRQDAALLIWRALGDPSAALSYIPYPDGSAVADYAQTGVAFIAQKGWIPLRAGSFDPQAPLTVSEAEAVFAAIANTRHSQAMRAFDVISTRSLDIKKGSLTPLEIPELKERLPFTPVYGIDVPDLGSLTPQGQFVIGESTSKKGTVTVNAGYSAYDVMVNFYGGSSSKKVDTNKSKGSLSPVESGREYTAKEIPFTYRIVSDKPDQVFQQTESTSYPGPEEGIGAKSDTWTGFYRQQGRDIIVDLGTPQPVASVSMEFMQDIASAIRFPEYMRTYLSTDGQNWSYLGQVRHDIPPSDKTVQTRTLSLQFPSASTRYIKISFPVDIWTFARRLSVTRGAESSKPLLLPKEDRAAEALKAPAPAPEPTYLQVPGMNDVLLVYTGGHEARGTWTSADFLPMIAHQDPKGSLTGRMFDTILFLPYSKVGSSRDEWQSYLDDLFAPYVQLSALNEALASMNKVMGTAEKEKVILTIPYPDPKQSSFGSLEQNGPALSFDVEKLGKEAALKNRLAAVDWFYGQLLSRWEQAHFEHLELAGIYWYAETMDARIPGEKELVQGTARLVRAKEQNFFWIPFHGANGYDDWRSYGFHYAFLQPNYYAEDPKRSDERMTRTADLARQYRMGVELECDDRLLKDPQYYQLFYKQLNRAHELGFDGPTTNVYYAESKTLVTVSRSSDPKIRAIYDDLYKWMIGLYKPVRQ
ncbi:DUF4855 domain-containing protein [Heliobacterium mobile]|nr:DUF4855 domain-containing protein [Heliobacterium mobile]